MLGPDDIEAFKDAEVADTVIERVKRGVSKGREIHASETMPLLRHLVRVQEACAGLIEFQRQAIAASAASMKMYDRDGRPVE